MCARCVAWGYGGATNTAYDASAVSYIGLYTKYVTFEPSEGVDKADSVAVSADLQQAEAYVAAHLYPEINYTVEADPDIILNLGDPVTVKHDRLNVDLLTTVKSLTYNAITGKYTKIEFGNFKKNVKGYARTLDAATK